MKESIGNEYIRRVKLIYKSNLNAWNFIYGMNAWALGVNVQRRNYRLNKEDMDRKNGKIITLNRCLHPRSSLARLNMNRKEGWIELISVEDCITTERRGLYDDLKNSEEDMLSGALKQNVIEERETKEEFTKRKMDERKKTLHEGKLQGQYVEKTWNIAHEFSEKLIRNRFFKRQRAC